MRTDDGSRPPGRRIAMDPTDAWWNGLEFTVGLLDADVPRVDAIADALTRLSVDPRLGTWVDGLGAAWQPVPANEVGDWVARSVIRSDDDVADLDTLMGLQSAPLGPLPARWLVGPDWLAVRLSHAFADGWTTSRYVRHVLAVATGERDAFPVPWTYLSPAHRTALATAAVASCPDPMTRADLRRRTAQPWEPADTHLAGQTASAVHRTSATGFGTRLRELGRDRFGLDGPAELLAAGLRTSVADALGTPRPGEGFVRDLRAGPAAEAFGNHSVAVRVRPERETSPRSIREAVDLASRTGLTHLTQLATRMRDWTHRSQRQVPGPTGHADLVLSVRDHRDPSLRLPGVRPTSRFGVLTSPQGPETIDVVAIESEDRWSLSTSFYESFWPRASVEAALDAFLDDPAGLLSRVTASA